MKRIVIVIIRAYQKIERALSPFQLPLIASGGCRSWPTCSEYTCQALDDYGMVRGLAKGIVRVVRCNPFFSPQ